MKQNITWPYFILMSISALSCGDLPPAQEEGTTLAKGKRLYVARCMTCHGKDGKGLRFGKPYAGDFTRPEGILTQPDAQLLESVANGKEGATGRMPAFKPVMSREDMAMALLYIRTEYGGEKLKDEAGPPAMPDK